jgi:hypothetical protein
MKKRLLVLAVVSSFGAACSPEGPSTVRGESGWWVHSNAAYGYQISYPEEYDLWPTGPEGQRDGATIRIARKNYAAPVPVLDVVIGPEESLREKVVDVDLVDMTAEVTDIDLGGKPGKQLELRWKANGELALVELSLDGVTFVFDAAPGLHEFEGTVWWEIVSSFRFLDR